MRVLAEEKLAKAMEDKASLQTKVKTLEDALKLANKDIAAKDKQLRDIESRVDVAKAAAVGQVKENMAARRQALVRKGRHVRPHATRAQHATPNT